MIVFANQLFVGMKPRLKFCAESLYSLGVFPVSFLNVRLKWAKLFRIVFICLRVTIYAIRSEGNILGGGNSEIIVILSIKRGIVLKSA